MRGIPRRLNGVDSHPLSLLAQASVCDSQIAPPFFKTLSFQRIQKTMSTSNENNSIAGTTLLAPDAILQSRYRVIRHLGRGGMGAVYEAVDLRLGHTVALKQALTSDEELWKQFEREARLMAGLNHPVLPRVSDYFTEGHRAFF